MDSKIKHEDISYPIPLSNGHVVTLKGIPESFNLSDAQKVTDVILTLGKPDQTTNRTKE